MNKWLYRAAGAVGVASGTLLLSSGVAHAETKTTVDPQAMHDGVAQYFTPNGPRFDGREELLGSLLGGGGDGPLGGLTGSLTGGDKASGKSGDNLLSGLTGGGELLGKVAGGANPLSDLTGGLVGLTGVTGSLTDDGSPMTKVTNGLTGGLAGDDDSLTNRLTGKLLGGGNGTQRDVPDSLSGLLNQAPASARLVAPAPHSTKTVTTHQRGNRLDPATARGIDDPTAPITAALIADAVAKHIGASAGADMSGPVVSQDGDDALSARAAGQVSPQEEGLPLVDDLPLVGALLGGDGPLSKVVGGDELPLVGTLLGNGLLKSGEAPSLPVVGALLGGGGPQDNLTPKAPTGPATPAQPGLLPPTDAKPPAQILPATGTAAQNSASPTVRDFKPAAGNRVKAPGKNPAKGPLHVGKHRATERPELTDPDYTDPDYLESGSLPLIGSLTGGELPLLGPLLQSLPGGLL